jgi:hypothetical protein
MAVEKVVIKVEADPGNKAAVKSTVDGLKEIGAVEQKNAETFKKTNAEYIDAAAKRKRIIAEEEANIKELEKAKKKAFSPEDIKLYNDSIKQSKENISLLKGETDKLEGSNNMLAKGFKMVGAAVIAAFSVSAIKDFAKAVIASTDSTADQYDKMIGGMNEATQYFYRTIATGNWDNFINGIRDAYKEGERYIDVLDLLEDQMNAMNVVIAKNNFEIAKQNEISRNAEFSPEQRLAAIKKIKELNEANANERRKIAQSEYDNELRHAQNVTKLGKDTLLKIFSDQKNFDDLSNGQKLHEQLKDEASTWSYNVKTAAIDKVFNKKKYDELVASQDAEGKRILFFNESMNLLTEESRKKLADSIVKLQNIETQKIQEDNEQLRRENGVRAAIKAEQVAGIKAVTDEKKKAFDREVALENLRIALIKDANEKLIAEENLRYKIELNSQDALYSDLKQLEEAKELSYKIHQQKLTKIQFDELEKRSQFEEAINLKSQSIEDEKIMQVMQKYDTLIADAVKYGIDYSDLTKKEIEEINKIIADGKAKQQKIVENGNKEIIKDEKDAAKLRKEELKNQLKFAQDISDAAFDQIKANHDFMMSMLDREITQQEKNIETQQRLAERGLSNTLSFEQNKANELEKQRIEAEKKEQKRQKAAEAAKLVLAFMSAYNLNMDAKQTPQMALANAFKDTMLAKIIGASIGGMFSEGGIVGIDGKNKSGLLVGPRHSQGGIHIEAEGGEGILSRKEINNMGVANFYNLKRLLKQPTSGTDVVGNNSEVLAGINTLNDTFKSIPKILYDVDNLNNLVKSEIKNGLKTVTTFKRRIN